MDSFVAFPACPQDIVSIQGGGHRTPEAAELRILDDAYPHIPLRGAWVPAHLAARSG